MINEKWSQPESAENPQDLIVDMENPFWTLYADLTRNDHMSGELWVQLNPEYLEDDSAFADRSHGSTRDA